MMIIYTSILAIILTILSPMISLSESYKLTLSGNIVIQDTDRPPIGGGKLQIYSSNIYTCNSFEAWPERFPLASGSHESALSR